MTTPSVIQSAYGFTNSGGNATATFGAATTAGNMVVAFVWCNFGGFYPSSFASANDTLAVIGTPAAEDRIWIYHKDNITGGDTVFTLTPNGAATYQRIWMVEIEGQDTAGAVDASVAKLSAVYSSSTDAITSDNLAASVANGLMLGIAWNGRDSTVPSAGTGFTSLLTSSDGAGDAGRVEYESLNASGNYAATWTTTAGGDEHIVSAVIIKPARAATVRQSLMMLGIGT